MSRGFQPFDPGTMAQPGEHWVEVMHGMSGWFACEVWLNNERPDLGPFMEPFDTGIGRYGTEAEACVEAWSLAEAQDLPYSLRFTPGMPEFDTARRAMLQRVRQ